MILAMTLLAAIGCTLTVFENNQLFAAKLLFNCCTDRSTLDNRLTHCYLITVSNEQYIVYRNFFTILVRKTFNINEFAGDSPILATTNTNNCIHGIYSNSRLISTAENRFMGQLAGKIGYQTTKCSNGMWS